MVEAQGGDPRVLDEPNLLHTAVRSGEVLSPRSGTVHGVGPRVLGEAVVSLGGGRARVEDAIDPGVGFEVIVEPGQRVEEGELLGIVHAQDEAAVEVGRRALLTSVLIGDGDPPEALPLIVDRIAAL
jgi:thymidine phosphorylase